MTDMTKQLPFEEGKLYSRGDIRKILGIDVTNMTFLRWEKKGLTPIKPGSKWAHVQYLGRTILDFFGLRSSK